MLTGTTLRSDPSLRPDSIESASVAVRNSYRLYKSLGSISAKGLFPLQDRLHGKSQARLNAYASSVISLTRIDKIRAAGLSRLRIDS